MKDYTVNINLIIVCLIEILNLFPDGSYIRVLDIKCIYAYIVIYIYIYLRYEFMSLVNLYSILILVDK